MGLVHPVGRRQGPLRMPFTQNLAEGDRALPLAPFRANLLARSSRLVPFAASSGLGSGGFRIGAGNLRVVTPRRLAAASRQCDAARCADGN